MLKLSLFTRKMIKKKSKYSPISLLYNMDKLSAYGCERKSLIFIFVYLKNKTQKTSIESPFTDYLNTLFTVPQRLH